MALYFELPVCKVGYELYLEFVKQRRTLPREERYTIGQELDRAMVEVLVLIQRINSTCEKVPLIARGQSQGGGRWRDEVEVDGGEVAALLVVVRLWLRRETNDNKACHHRSTTTSSPSRDRSYGKRAKLRVENMDRRQRHRGQRQRIKD